MWNVINLRFKRSYNVETRLSRDSYVVDRVGLVQLAVDDIYESYCELIPLCGKPGGR